MDTCCLICEGACRGADLAPLIDPRLAWLWEQLGAAADRRGDADLTQGALQVRVPESAEERSAGSGLLGGRVLRAAQTRRVELSDLTKRLRARGPMLTPGAVAAHALQRPLASRARAEVRREAREQQLKALFEAGVRSLPEHAPVKPEPQQVWRALRRSGWIARLLSTGEPERLLRSSISVLAALPAREARTDRRRLASATTGNPHALDEGVPLGGLVLAVLVAAGRVQPRQRARMAWAEAGVDCDDVTGGFISVGIHPVGWDVPPGAVLTIPPRVLSTCEWPAPSATARWVFITENPSVATAAADLAVECPNVRLLCTSGTPSHREIASVARLAAVGWRVAVRADFDEAGIGHVTAMLKGVPGAEPWRMGADDYLESLNASHDMTDGLRLAHGPECEWDLRLSSLLKDRAVAAFEEALLPRLLEDLRQGLPGARTEPQWIR